MSELVSQKYIHNSEESNRKFVDNLPLVSIITVVYNDKEKLEKTILGILGQSYKNIEYIIVDGGSEDGTVEIIKKYENKINYWVSEKDKGIYDAMNKGIDLVHGEWVNFMNAGDMFCDSNILEKVFTNRIISSDLIYGSAIFKSDDCTLISKPAGNSLDDLWKQSQFGHESLFTRSIIMRENKFDRNYRVAADHDFIMSCYYLHNYKFENLGLDVLLFISPFFSNKHWIRSSIETWRIARKYKGGLAVDLFYCKSFFTSLFVILVKKVLPDKVYAILKKAISRIIIKD